MILKKTILIYIAFCAIIMLTISSCTSNNNLLNNKSQIIKGINQNQYRQSNDNETINNDENIKNKNILKENKISITELSRHNKESDCWISYKGKIYDITNFLPKHKNYTNLLVPLCGKSTEFEQTFTAKHGTSKVEVLLRDGVLKGILE
ncbi:MAG: cytochrome b5-like heme/steroid binding domain-containing protein [Candidatus Woesearchaeota archaeon]